jgi:predicted CXXCH cytochrome family protein
MTCVTCHDPHAADPAEKMAALERPSGNGVCTRCHEDKRGDANLAAHTHHRPDGAGAACINCHMSQKNMGLSYALTRYHRIGSPTERPLVEGDRRSNARSVTPTSASASWCRRWNAGGTNATTAAGSSPSTALSRPFPLDQDDARIRADVARWISESVPANRRTLSP